LGAFIENLFKGEVDWQDKEKNQISSMIKNKKMNPKNTVLITSDNI
jgi:hypothetical protein